jgi:aspartyl/asparaginyl beta-hydroxylase (cupin superfamily)
MQFPSGQRWDAANLRALLQRADGFVQSGDSRAAASFYRAAIKSAPLPHLLPPDLANEIRRAQALCDRYADEFAGFLKARLAAAGFDDTRSGRRFAASLDIMLGKKQVFMQQPTQFYFPELPQIQFYEREQFPWLDAVEAAASDIRAELLEIIRQPDAFTPYVESDAARPGINNDAGLTESSKWSAFYLWRNGVVVEPNAARCPRTMQALEHVPFDRIEGKTPSVLFSRLLPGAHIPPHTGFMNTRLICHLGLIVPNNCWFRVGNDVREWQEGKACIFDDTIQHEAWNRSQQTRVVLLFDIWRPELTEEERRLVSALLEATATYTAG